jgi:hypothetical protein
MFTPIHRIVYVCLLLCSLAEGLCGLDGDTGVAGYTVFLIYGHMKLNMFVGRLLSSGFMYAYGRHREHTRNATCLHSV